MELCYSEAVGIGDMTFITTDTDKLVTISAILHVPEFKHNLISTRQLEAKGCTILSKAGKTWVFDNDDRPMFSATYEWKRGGYVINWHHVQQVGQVEARPKPTFPVETALRAAQVQHKTPRAPALSTATTSQNSKDLAEEALLWHRKIGRAHV